MQTAKGLLNPSFLIANCDLRSGSEERASLRIANWYEAAPTRYECAT
ncbi:hypothetical protein [Nostoc sp. MG11]|nr:hypothetical protein [Nostoc sp. MG11]